MSLKEVFASHLNQQYPPKFVVGVYNGEFVSLQSEHLDFHSAKYRSTDTVAIPSQLTGKVYVFPLLEKP